MLKLLTSDQIEKIHASSLKILEEVGVLIHDDEFLKFLSDNGVNVDFNSRRAKIPASLAKECIKKAPKQVTLYGREPKYAITLGDGKIYTHPVGGAANVVDLNSGKVRPSTREDVENLTRIVDFLPNIHSQTMIVYPTDVPEHLRDIYAVEAIIRNTGKNFDVTPYNDTNYQYIIRMLETVVGREELMKRPIATTSISPTSPLQFSKDATKIMVRATKYNIPIAVLPCPLSGATSPITLAGTILQQNVEVLAGIVMVQLLNPKNPVEYSPRCIPLSMSTGQACDGIEAALMSVGCVQLAKFYGLPCDVYGLDTDSKVLDEQAAFEKAFNGILPALAGADALSGAGCIESGITVSYEQLVIDDEIFGMIFRAVKGIAFDEEKLAVDIITKVVNESSNFLQQKHTLKHYREEYFIPKLVDRSSRSQWKKMGSKSIVEVAREKVRKILAEHEPPQLDKNICKQHEEILKSAIKDLESQS
ncbi:MAG: trimethylamine methyltransferase family protein [Candidatus Bathyarchaeia archaeon]